MTRLPPSASIATPPSLPRVLSLPDSTCIVIGAIIGVGIFFNPRNVALTAGAPTIALLAWCAGGLIAMAGALTFAALGRAYHGPGAQYEILRDAYGPLLAFLFVFCNATAIQSGAIAVIAVICVENLSVAILGHFPGSTGNASASSTYSATTVTLLSAALIALITAANALGVRWGARIQNLTVYTKVAVLVAIIALAVFLPRSNRDAPAHLPSHDRLASAPSSPSPAVSSTDPIQPAVDAASTLSPTSSPPTPALPPVAALLAAIVPCLFAYGGWQHALWISGEIKNPARNVPLSIIIGVSIVVAVYLGANWAYLRLLGYDGVVNATTLAADAVAVVWPSGARAVAAGVGISALGVLNAQLLSGPRLVQRMAHDGRFFSTFARLNPRFSTPIPAIFLLAILALLLLFTAGKDGTDSLVTGVVLIDCVFFALTGLSLIVLRAKLPPDRRPPPSFLHPFVPLLFFLAEIAVFLGAYADPGKLTPGLIGTGWVGIAVLIYFSRFSKHRA